MQHHGEPGREIRTGRLLRAGRTAALPRPSGDGARAKPSLGSIIELGPDDPVVGRVLCDDIAVLYWDELSEDRGALAPSTMAASLVDCVLPSLCTDAA